MTEQSHQRGKQPLAQLPACSDAAFRDFDRISGQNGLLILNQQHLEHVLAVFAAHYDGHRPHRALGLKPPCPTHSLLVPAAERGEIRVEHRDRLGGVVHEYVLAA
jgi:hypothetical protein